MGMSTVAQMPLTISLPSTSEYEHLNLKDFLSLNPPAHTRSLRHPSEQDSMSGNDYESTSISSTDQFFILAL